MSPYKPHPWRYDRHEQLSWWTTHFEIRMFRDDPPPRLCPSEQRVFGLTEIEEKEESC